MRTKIVIFAGIVARDKSKHHIWTIDRSDTSTDNWIRSTDFQSLFPFPFFRLDSLPMTRVARVDRAITGPVGGDFARGTGDHHRSSVGTGYRGGSGMRARKHGAMGCRSCENRTVRCWTCYHRPVATNSPVFRISCVTVGRTGVSDTCNIA